MIEDMEASKKLSPIVTELFMKEKSRFTFLKSQSYFKVPTKDC